MITNLEVAPSFAEVTVWPFGAIDVDRSPDSPFTPGFQNPFGGLKKEIGY